MFSVSSLVPSSTSSISTLFYCSRLVFSDGAALFAVCSIERTHFISSGLVARLLGCLCFPVIPLAAGSVPVTEAISSQHYESLTRPRPRRIHGFPFLMCSSRCLSSLSAVRAKSLIALDSCQQYCLNFKVFVKCLITMQHHKGRWSLHSLDYCL